MIPTDVIERVKDAADIVQLIGEHVELKRTGADYRGPCPFHGGTNRNFSVVPKKQLYHCFVCHESGDIFTFYMKKFGLDYPSAVREIAGKSGITVPEDARDAGPDPNEPLYSALGIAAEWFSRRLREADDAGAARAYLASRGIADEVRDQFGLGYAPHSRDEFLKSMKALGVDEETLIAAGLALKKDDGSVGPRFWGRLLFPIADVRGRVVGFGGRILGDGEPKYLNSPESAVFHKGTLLYLLDRARGAIRTEEHAVVVEGYVDAIRLHAAGITCVVAPLGTALTAEQAKVLRRYTKQVVLSYDADGPGLRSTFRAGDELLRHDVTVQVITLPDGEDPDTLVRKQGAEGFRALLRNAVDVFDRKLQILDRHGHFNSLEGRREALDKLLATIRAASDPVTRDLYIDHAARRTGIAKDTIAQEAGKSFRGQAAPRPAESTAARSEERVPEIRQERDVLHLMIGDTVWLKRARAELRAVDFRHPLYRKLASAVMDGLSGPPDELVPLWESLRSPPEGTFDAEAAFAAGVAWMKDRPRLERLAEIDRLIALADGEQKQMLADEKRSLLASGEKRYRRKAFQAEREPQ